MWNLIVHSLAILLACMSLAYSFVISKIDRRIIMSFLMFTVIAVLVVI